ncbi:MAG: ATP-binding cassette domain-containing protein, partial [Pyrinomonadaceae bacterium]|nr:ATP-binding cassette domain-containing protein [Sphingobacteriaceae bacterium]
SKLRLQIGYVIQHVGLFPHMTIHDNIKLLGKVLHKPNEQMDKRVAYLMDLVQLPLEHLNKFPHELSGGEQQRAGLCRALFLNPAMMLMDEPFASLDYSTKHGIYRHFLAMQRTEPRTIIMVTHDWEEAMILADNFVWLEKATIKASGVKADLEELKSSYLFRI